MPPPPTIQQAVSIYRILAEEMQTLGLADLQALSYWRLPNRTDFDAKAERLAKFLKGQHRDRRVQDGILRIGVQLLIRHFQRYAEETGSFILGPEVIARNIAKIPARLDREFPGYGACGMLHLLVK